MAEALSKDHIVQVYVSAMEEVLVNAHSKQVIKKMRISICVHEILPFGRCLNSLRYRKQRWDQKSLLPVLTSTGEVKGLEPLSWQDQIPM